MSLKAGYAVNELMSFYRFIPHSIDIFNLREMGLRDHWVKRPHAIVDRPIILTPSISPRLGASGKHKELHRYALWQIFRPAFRSKGLTRILHHFIIIFIIPYILKNKNIINDLDFQNTPLI